MRILVYPHTLELGGSQLNAIELAAAVRDLGHEVLVTCQPGALQDRIAELDLEFAPAPVPGRRPSPAVMSFLCQLARDRSIDLVHGYEWTAGLETYLGPRWRNGTAAVCTVMSMAVAPFLPRDLPLIVGTRQIAAHERGRGRSPHVIEPPVDLVHNRAATSGDLDALKRRFGLAPDKLTVVSVTRLAQQLKLEGTLTAIEVIGQLAATLPVQLLLVGDGPDRDLVTERAQAANARAGRSAVVCTGELADPRPAYAVADIALGMGGSALRAMAFGAPLIVQGERGFWERLDPATSARFAWTGWYGVGGDAGQGPRRLRDLLLPLLGDAGMRAELGAYAHRLAVDRYALDRAGRLQAEIYERAVARALPRATSVIPTAVGAGRFLHYKSARLSRKLSGRVAADDFNARPVAATAPSRVPKSATTVEETTVSFIPLVDLSIQHQEVSAEIEEGFSEVLQTGDFIGGKSVVAFEREFADFLGARHCIGVGNGTDALELALRAVGVGADDEVVLPANTFVATAEAVARIGARPVPIDVDDEALLIDPFLLDAAITERTRAVMPVHLYGQSAPVEHVAAVIGDRPIVIVEDAAQSQGARRFGRSTGCLGQIAGTSFYPGKNLGAYGDAGAVITADEELADRVRLLGAHGSAVKYRHTSLGFNSRLDTLQAVVLRAKLARLTAWNAQRRDAASRYDEMLAGVRDVRRPATLAGNEHVWHLYVVRVTDRDSVLERLHHDGIGAGIHYPVPVHLQPAFSGLGYGPASFPVTERSAAEILSLPLFPGITYEQQERVVESLVRGLG